MKNNFKIPAGFEPELVCGLLHKIGHEKRFEKLVHNKHGMKLRKISLYAITIPLDDKNYNNSINYLKSFLCPVLSRILAVIPFRKFVDKKLNKYGLSFVNTPQVRRPSKHPLNHCGFSPFMMDTKFKDFKFNGIPVYNKEQRKNFERLKNFESTGYKVMINNKLVDIDLIISDEDLK